MYSRYFYVTTNAGNNWNSNPAFSLDTNCYITDGLFTDNLNGWIISERGLIYKTTNGGANWIRFNAGFALSSCLSISRTGNNIWIGGSSSNTGCILKSTNGGANWNLQTHPGNHYIRFIKFLDNNNGWALSDISGALRTTDGGNNWIQRPILGLPSGSININLSPLSMNECYWLIDYYMSASYSRIYRTTNGGYNWNLILNYRDSINYGSIFQKVNFINSGTGFLNGDFRYIMRTTNSGTSWDSANVGTMIDAPHSFYSTKYINSNSLFLCGGYGGVNEYYPHSPSNVIYKSTNYGANWILSSRNTAARFYDIKFTDSYTGFVLTDTGKILKTSNSGLNWTLIYDNNSYYLNNIYFANSLTGCATCRPTYVYPRGYILRTTNGGVNWQKVTVSNSKYIYSLGFSNSQNGYAGSDSNQFFRTTDAGATWSPAFLSASVQCRIDGINFVNAATGWLLGYYYYYSGYSESEKNIIWKTTNSGNNWSIVFDSSLTNGKYITNLNFINSGTGYRTTNNAYNTVYKTTNGGSNWTALSVPDVPYPYTINFVDQNTGWVAGKTYDTYHDYGIVIKTTNGGISWFKQFYEYGKIVRSFFPFNSNSAWFCGDLSSIYKTTDGGGNIGILPVNNEIPRSYSLYQNYPNPFNNCTLIRFNVPASGNVRITIYDILGKEVLTLLNEKLSPGIYEKSWDAVDTPSGIYFYSISAANYSETRKMVLVK